MISASSAAVEGRRQHRADPQAQAERDENHRYPAARIVRRTRVGSFIVIIILLVIVIFVFVVFVEIVFVVEIVEVVVGRGRRLWLIQNRGPAILEIGVSDEDIVVEGICPAGPRSPREKSLAGSSIRMP